MSEFHQQLGAFEVWTFPSLEDNNENMECRGMDVSTTEELSADADERARRDAAVSDSLTSLKNKIDVLDNITANVNRKLSEIDETLVNNVILLIKNSVKKIIHKEIALDDGVLKHMISQSLQAISAGGDACVVYVSEDDYHVLHHDLSLSQLDIRCDHNLSRGDYVIKTKLSELEAILEQRLQSLFGL